MSHKKTLFEKIWSSHIVRENSIDGEALIYIDRHLIHEVTSPQAFEGLSIANREVRNPMLNLAVADHNVPTDYREGGVNSIKDDVARLQVETLEKNVAKYNIPYIPLIDERQGIVHIVGPELGFTLPGTTIVCGDSHTSTHGAFGAFAFGIGTSEVEHVLATQTLVQKKPITMRITVNGSLPIGVNSKDLILSIIQKIGTSGGTGYVIEYAGDTITSFTMEERMTICNMTIEAGARAGVIAPDEVTFKYIKGKPMAPNDEQWETAVNEWKLLNTDLNAVFDKEYEFYAGDLSPYVTWGTSPEDVLPVDGHVPDPKQIQDKQKRESMEESLSYMGLKAGIPIESISIDKVFIGSCTNGRLEDLRSVAEVVKGRKVSDKVEALIVPGSGIVKKLAEKEGIDKVFKDSGFQWRSPGCSMCLGMNPDQLNPGERCASTSNRNFKGRQGKGGRTHLMSPAMAAAAAIKGHITDVRSFF